MSLQVSQAKLPEQTLKITGEAAEDENFTALRKNLPKKMAS